MTINNTEYFESNTATASDAKFYLSSNPEKVTHASNRILEQNLLSFRTIPFLPPSTNPGIVVVVLTPPTLLTPVTNEIVVEAASGGAWASRTPRQFSKTGVNRSTPGNIGNYIVIVETSSLDIIVIIGTAPPCGLNMVQEVGDIRPFNSQDLVIQSQKSDATVNGKLYNNPDMTSVFSKVLGDKPSESSSWDLYIRCRMDLKSDLVQILTPRFVYLGLLTIDAPDKGRIWRPIDGDHWCVINHIFGETTAVGVSEEKSDCDYNYKTYFQIWK